MTSHYAPLWQVEVEGVEIGRIHQWTDGSLELVEYAFNEGVLQLGFVCHSIHRCMEDIRRYLEGIPFEIVPVE